MAWVYLVFAIIFEVGATLSLRPAVDNKRWYIPVAIGYTVAFSLLSLTLSEGMALGVAYGIWSATGVALTAILSRLVFKEPLTWVMGVGLALIMSGVLLIELGAAY